MGTHSIVSPSGAARWIACPPSARWEEQIPEEHRDYAAEGTLAHAVAAEMLKKVTTPRYSDAELDALTKNPYYDYDVKFYGEQYKDYVVGLAQGGYIHIEQKLDMSRTVPGCWGTADAMVMTPKGVLHVIDYKYGQGVRVAADDNPQLKLYAIGAMEWYAKNASTSHTGAVVLHIYQPRVRQDASVYETHARDLWAWVKDTVRPAARLAMAGDGEFAPGKHCNFCKAKTKCAAYYREFAALRGLQDARELTPAQRAEVLSSGDLLAKWIGAVKADSIEMLTRDCHAIPGFKVVEGKGRRQWADADAVVKALTVANYTDIYEPRKLLALTGLEKMLGKKRFAELLSPHVITVPGSPTITTEDDPRPAIGAAAAEKYNDWEDLL